MLRILLLLGFLVPLAACGDGQPLFDEDGGDGTGVDTDGDGIPDSADDDDDGDGIEDDDEADTDADGIIDDIDTDDDNDGIPDAVEPDADADGLIDDRDPDDDNDGTLDADEPDTDRDGVIDDRDPDDDNDGILDVDEGAAGGGGFSDTGGIGAIPAAISQDLQQVVDNGDGTLTVTIRSLDTTPVVATYARNEVLDVPGYAAYSVQEDPLDRMFIALTRTSTDGSVSGGVVADGGQFNRVFGGAYYRREGEYAPPDATQPDNGLVSYAGDYAGLTNINAPRPGEILEVPDGTDPSVIPSQAGRVTGDVFINADFSDNSVNGSVYNREIADNNVPLDDTVLIVTGIADNGTFQGTVENPGQVAIGSYGGVFGGVGATAVAGGLVITNYTDLVENEIEWGSFVLTACGQPGDVAICDGVNPLDDD